jgi:hypothetical protein
MIVLNTRPKPVRLDPRKLARLWRALIGGLRMGIADAILDGMAPPEQPRWRRNGQG